MAHQNQLMQSQSAAFQKQMAAMSKANAANLTKQFAVQRQQNLSSQLQAQSQAKIQGAQQAQQGLTAGGAGFSALNDPLVNLTQARKTALEDIHAKALRNTGVPV
jgi:hypothetical protein